MIIRTFLVGLLLSGVATAQKVPKGTFNASQYAEAKAEAAEEGKNIAVIYTEIDSSCPKCRYGTETAFKDMRSSYVLVLEDKGAKSETGTLPQDIKQKTYVTYKEKGNFIPIITVFSPDTDTVLSGASYDQISADERKWLKNVEAEIEAKPSEPAPKETEEAPSKETAETVCETGGLREWTDVRGRTMKAEFVHADDMKVTFKLESGKVIELPLSKLSDESQAAVKECR
ncbi:hypothetical protein [Haloferula sp.]|uniref:hypothetical protein n=1 Tax=Haloferula sp. TaxID=2497595 RepID=UPI00329E8CD2